MTKTEATERLRQTKTPELVVKTERHDRLCLASGREWIGQFGVTPGACSCGGPKSYGYTYSIVLDTGRAGN